MKNMIKSTIIMLLVGAFVVKAGELGQETLQGALPESVAPAEVPSAETLSSTMQATPPAPQVGAVDVLPSTQVESIPSQPQTFSELEGNESYDTGVAEEAPEIEQMPSQDMTTHEVDTSPVSQEELAQQIEGYTQEVNKDTQELKAELNQTADVLKQTGIASDVAPAFEQEGNAIQKDVENIEATEKEIESAVAGKPMSVPAGKKTMKCVCDVE